MPTKVCIAKAMVFLVVMYGCESWTIKKAEHRGIDAFELWYWRRLLRVPWTARRSNQSILKEINPEYSLEGLMLKLKLQYLGHLMQTTDSLEKTLMLGKTKGRRRGRRQRMMVWWYHKSMDMSLRKLWKIVEDRGAWWATVHGLSNLTFQEFVLCWGTNTRSLSPCWNSSPSSLIVVQLTSRVWFLWPHRGQHARLLCPLLSPRVCSNSCPLHQWYYLPISSFAALFFCLQSSSTSGSFPMSQLFASGGQSIGASMSILPMNILSWFPLGLTGLIFLLSKGLSRVFSNTTVWKHQFFGTQPSLWSNSHIHTWLLEKP